MEKPGGAGDLPGAEIAVDWAPETPKANTLVVGGATTVAGDGGAVLAACT